MNTSEIPTMNPLNKQVAEKPAFISFPGFENVMITPLHHFVHKALQDKINSINE